MTNSYRSQQSSFYSILARAFAPTVAALLFCTLLFVGCSAKPEMAAAPPDSASAEELAGGNDVAEQVNEPAPLANTSEPPVASENENPTGSPEALSLDPPGRNNADTNLDIKRNNARHRSNTNVPVLDGPSLPNDSHRPGDVSNARARAAEGIAEKELALESEGSHNAPSGTPPPSNSLNAQPDRSTPADSSSRGKTKDQLKDHLKDLESAQTVEVFFATDRLPTSEVLPSMLRTFMPAIAVGCICWAMFIGLAIVRRWQTYWMLGAGLATCCGVIVLHLCIVRWQEYSRLASNHSTRFSVLRYEPEGNAYPLHLGRADVSIPWNHQPGVIERPSLLRLEFTESPDKHVMIQRVEVREHVGDWFTEVSEHVRFAEEREGFMFIHGYNVKFGDAIRRTAQLASDLKVRGPVLSYSWPSRGQLAAYAADEASVSWSSPKLEKLLTDLVAYTEIRSINIVAHSMGNRALLESIERLHLRSGPDSGVRPNRNLLGSVIMAAPDVDAQIFNARYAEALQSVSDRATLYFTNDDLALQLSKRIHVAPRLGLEVLPGDFAIEAVHTGDQGLFTLGHSYYGNDPVVIEDMQRVLQHRTPAAERSHLRVATLDNGLQYFELDRSRFAQRQSDSKSRL
ncbi:MAG: alpha/beta hydrolase [Aureliella sp.]